MKKVGDPTPRKRLRDAVLIALASSTATALVGFLLVPWLLPQLRKANTADLIALCSVLLAGLGLTWQLVAHRLRASSKVKVGLAVQVHGDRAVVSAAVTNIGTRRITPTAAYLFVDEGIERDGNYVFPFLLRHEEGNWDCVLARICKQEKLQYPIDSVEKAFKGIYTDYLHLQHLSQSSILFIDPGEQFSEDVVLKPPKPGVFRVMMVYTAKDCECVCSSKAFIIEKH